MSDYSEKLQDPRWQKTRLKVFERDDFSCCICQDTTVTLHVHHKSYSPNTDAWDYPLDNFQTLCKHCHQLVETFKKTGCTLLHIYLFPTPPHKDLKRLCCVYTDPALTEKAIVTFFQRTSETMYKSDFTIRLEFLQSLVEQTNQQNFI